jgi:biopolymer transport protein ExbD
MAGVDVPGGTGGGRRKTVDSEINMIPMIDLLMVTISFLLITAVWTHMSRLSSDAQVPGPTTPENPPTAPEKQLHVLMQGTDKFVLAWKQGATTLESMEVARTDVVVRVGAVETVRFPDLAAKIESEWRAKGSHVNPTDAKQDEAVLHSDNDTDFKTLVGVMDAIDAPHREMATAHKSAKVPAFNLTFAVN